ncbi:MAG: GGDEF domain-containing protein, partial [Armatimonadetes bacterium]|nr:GGDEF domain-containing protein [Armatimonadota bacterium]
LERDRPLSVLLMDVDHFKQFNDTYGHQAGDEVLRLVASTLQRCCEGTSFPARYGGEEFVALLPDMDEEQATRFAEGLRQAIADIPCCYRQITCSIGVSTVTLQTLNPDSLVEEADQALYVSKRRGRNRVSHARAEGIYITDIAPEEWQQRVEQAMHDAGGYAAQQVVSQMIYDHLQAMRRARCAVQTGDLSKCFREGECRLKVWQEHALRSSSLPSELLQQLIELHEQFHDLLAQIRQQPSAERLEQLYQRGWLLVDIFQEMLAVTPRAA